MCVPSLAVTPTKPQQFLQQLLAFHGKKQKDSQFSKAFYFCHVIYIIYTHYYLIFPCAFRCGIVSVSRYFAQVLFQSHYYGIVTTLKLILMSAVDYLNITSHKCLKTVLQINWTTQILWKVKELRNCSREEQVTFDTDQFEVSHGCVQHQILTDSTDTELVSIWKTIEIFFFHNDYLKMIDTKKCIWHMLIFSEMLQTGNWLFVDSFRIYIFLHTPI